jgi:hypothetical protein
MKMRKAWQTMAIFLSFLLLTTLACALPTGGSTGPLPTPTPQGDSLELLIPAFTFNMEPGDVIPGTRLEYLGKSGDVYEVAIDGVGLRYNNIFVNYNVPVGRTLPGTTLIYDGVAQQGEIDSARLIGTEGHPLFAVGDSITWKGTLRDNVSATYTFRVVNYNEENLQVTGTAEIWIQD